VTTEVAAPRADIDDPPAETSSRGPALLVLVAVILGTGIRIGFLLSHEGSLDGDEAVTGIMAHRMASSHAFYAFFAGQPYNGAFEQYVQASLFRVGMPENAFTLRIPELVLAGLSCWLMYLVGLRLFRSRWHAALASLLFALGPYFVIWEGARSAGGYVSELVVVLVGVLCAVDADPETSSTRQHRLLFGFGICVGLTYWLTLSGYYLLVPAALWIVPSVVRSRRSLAAAGGGLIVGLIPIIAWTIDRGRVPQPNPRRPVTTPLERFGNLTDPIGREFLGVAHLYGRPGWPVAVGRLLVALLLVVALAALALRRRSVWRLVTLRRSRRRPLDIVLLAVPVMLLAYVASSFAWFTKEPRYLFCGYPVLILGLAALPPLRRTTGLLAALALVAVVGGPSLTLLITHADDAPAHRDRDLRRAVALLRANRTTRVYADYWTAMPLQFVAKDSLTVGSLSTTARFPSDRQAVDATASPVWVASRNINADDITPMRDALTRAHIGFRERRLGGVSLFDRFSRPVRPWQVGIGAVFRPS